ncbi:uncharacterized protein LOC116704644 [Etheostoma spectabile]|uniref:uncharacterized protein LOC116704644 n=1 Tax=Etheostoma spectabile TaxID=54343 RepID=UPI0013AE9C02|nr:uncharacterized protein LOC116704644 [Etheostoma spectabile]
MISLMLVFLLGGLWDTEAMSITGVLGSDVTIKCSHSNAFYNAKYFCNGACRNEDILISSRTNNDLNKKYSIKDEGNTFYVTISHLKQDDSGMYWCGIERIGLDTYSQVFLTVINENTKDPQSNVPSSKKRLYIGAGLGVVVLALAMVLLTFFRHRNRDIRANYGKDQDTIYTTPSSQKLNINHETTSSSTANEDQETDSKANSIFCLSTVEYQDHSDNIYSNVIVSSKSQIQPEGLSYASVRFKKHTDSSTVTPGLTYATIQHKATDESTVYCNV